MANTPSPSNQRGVPEGFVAIPVSVSEMQSTLRLCAVVRRTPDPTNGHYVVLRDLPDAMVYLGCVIDTSGRIYDWVELWFQNVDGLDSSLPNLREAFSNHHLDERWAAMAKSFALANPETIIATGHETKHPLPTFVNFNQAAPVHPGAAGDHWELCQDDTALQAAGLPPFKTSLFRYLHQPGVKDGKSFVPVTAGAPTGPATQPVVQVVGDAAHVPLNPQGGLMLAQSFCPLSFEDYVDLLGGKPWPGLEAGKRAFNCGGVYNTLNDWEEMQRHGAHLFLGNEGRAGRFVEGLHLRLQLLADIIRDTRIFSEQQQLPLLNLGSDSFRVRLNDVGARLPFLWTAQGELVKPSEAFALPVQSSEYRYFIRARATGTSIYQPEGLNAAMQSTGNVRIRAVLPPDQGRTRVEGTLVMQDRVNVSPHDLLWIRLPLPSGRVDLYGNLYTTDGMAQGEARFRTVPQNLPADVVSALKAAEGVSFARSPFEVVPLLSSPCDLYSLGVLAVRALLVNPQTTLAVALDEVLSLARQVGTDHKADVSLPARILAALETDTRFAKSLSPHRLMQEPMDPMDAFQLVPPELWYDVLGFIIRLFPGTGPDSFCKDFGDAPPQALETVFNKPLEQIDDLVRRTRSLIVIDWSTNREIHSAIRDYLDRNRSAVA